MKVRRFLWLSALLVQAVYVSMGKRHDYRPALQHIQARTLVLHGENDILPESIAREYAQLIPGAKLFVLPAAKTRAADGLGHFPFSDDPQAFGQVVGEFLALSQSNDPGVSHAKEEKVVAGKAR